MEREAAGISRSMPSSADNASKMCQAAGHQVHAGYSEGYRERSIRYHISELCHAQPASCTLGLRKFQNCFIKDRVPPLALDPTEQLKIKMKRPDAFYRVFVTNQ